MTGRVAVGVLVLLLVGWSEQLGEWGYEVENGPDTWAVDYPMCAGDNQSPVNIDTSTTVGDLPWPALIFTDFDRLPTAMSLTNSGHSAELRINDTWAPSVSGGDYVASQYTLEQIQFHWGRIGFAGGSEHTVDNNRAAAEMHFMHYDPQYGTFVQALANPGGVTILSVLLELSAEDNPGLVPIVDALPNITPDGAVTRVDPFPLMQLLPQSQGIFYRYNGSLTIPDCSEGVVWTVFADTSTISATQLAAFDRMETHDGIPLQNNFRPVQPLNNRTIYDGLCSSPC